MLPETVGDDADIGMDGSDVDALGESAGRGTGRTIGVADGDDGMSDFVSVAGRINWCRGPLFAVGSRLTPGVLPLGPSLFSSTGEEADGDSDPFTGLPSVELDKDENDGGTAGR